MPVSARNMEDVAEVFKTLKFRKKLIGGVDEMDVWKKLDLVQKEYRSAYEMQEERYKALLAERDAEIVSLKNKDSGGGKA